MWVGMSTDRKPSQLTLRLPTLAEEEAANAYATKSFQRVLSSWVQDLLERRRLACTCAEMSTKKAA